MQYVFLVLRGIRPQYYIEFIRYIIRNINKIIRWKIKLDAQRHYTRSLRQFDDNGVVILESSMLLHLMRTPSLKIDHRLISLGLDTFLWEDVTEDFSIEWDKNNRGAVVFYTIEQRQAHGPKRWLSRQEDRSEAQKVRHVLPCSYSMQLENLCALLNRARSKWLSRDPYTNAR
jgi:hypothetical protein